MSQAVKIALYARMTTDTVLPGLLTAHPADPAKKAILNGTKSQFPPIYNCLTYRIEQATPDNRFRSPVPGSPALAGSYTQGIEDFYLDCEAWTQTGDSGPLDAINSRLDALFHFQSFPTSAGPVFFCERITRQSDLYDKTLNAWFSVSRYRLRFQSV